MNNQPGISRTDRLSDEGLRRLEQQLSRGARMKPEILAQWIKRYGDDARAIIEKYSATQSET